MTELKNLNHEEIFDPAEIIYKISPSNLYKFNSERKAEWFLEQIAKFRNPDTNEYFLLGTIVHRAAEMYIKNRRIDYESLRSIIDIAEQPANPEERFDKEYLKTQIEPMANTVIRYMTDYNIPNKSEVSLKTLIAPDIYVAGTYDALDQNDGNNILIDFKTTSQKSEIKKISEAYRLQLLTYAYILSKNDVHIDVGRIVYISRNEIGRISEKTGKPMKDYPSEYTVIDMPIENKDIAEIEKYLHLIADTIDLYRNNPQLAYILFCDPELKEDPTGKAKIARLLKERDELLLAQNIEPQDDANGPF